MFKYNDLNSRFFGSPADVECVRADFEPDGFNLVVFRATGESVVHRYHEPHKNAHQRGMELYQKEIGYRRTAGGMRGGH